MAANSDLGARPSFSEDARIIDDGTYSGVYSTEG